MARATITTENGEQTQVDLPDFAMDSTAGDIVSILEQLYKAQPDKKTTKGLAEEGNSLEEKTLDASMKSLKGDKEAAEDMKKALNRIVCEISPPPRVTAAAKENNCVRNAKARLLRIEFCKHNTS